MLSCTIGVKNVNTIDYSEKELRAWSDKKILKCPVCGERLIYKHGLVRVPHFAHEKDKECTYTFFENETKEHMCGKTLLYKMLQKNNKVLNLQLESYISETKQRPDLYFEVDTQKYVIEYQCSPILLSEFKERRELYKLADIKDIWIFGAEKYKYTDNGKLKMKVSEEQWWLYQNRIYYLNAFKEILYKFYRIYDFETRFPTVSIDLKNDFNFSFDNYEIMFDGLEYKREIKEKVISDDCNTKQELNNQSLEEENQQDITIKINNLLNEKTIYLYNNFNTIKSEKSKNHFYYITYKGKLISKDWLLKEIYNSYDKIVLENDIHIFLPRWNIFEHNMEKFFKICFPYNKIKFVNKESL